MTFRGEFSDLNDVSDITQVCVRLGMAMLLGGVLGLERELRGHEAGLRTHMLVALGSALFVLVPLQAGMHLADASRVLQGILAGIGFLGAGAIMKGGPRQVHGLTTAAGIWLTAAIGVAAGLGREATAILATAGALVILVPLKKWEMRLKLRRKAAAGRGQAAGDAAAAAAVADEDDDMDAPGAPRP
ncbi:MgtC/SapB family protein [Pigmentiphaga soli]|uniref:Protein MgtC n=2 Tax=Pigmentiphaga soli TaxID=1007095 RepID=A0ABP8HKM7_9BURK